MLWIAEISNGPEQAFALVSAKDSSDVRSLVTQRFPKYAEAVISVSAASTEQIESLLFWSPVILKRIMQK